MQATLENMQAVETAGLTGVLAFSFVTGEEYSATYGDYSFHGHPAGWVMEDSAGEPMVLVRRVTRFEAVEL